MPIEIIFVDLSITNGDDLITFAVKAPEEVADVVMALLNHVPAFCVFTDNTPIGVFQTAVLFELWSPKTCPLLGLPNGASALFPIVFILAASFPRMGAARFPNTQCPSVVILDVAGLNVKSQVTKSLNACM